MATPGTPVAGGSYCPACFFLARHVTNHGGGDILDRYLAAPTYEARLTVWEGFMAEADPRTLRQAQEAVQQVLIARSGQVV